MNVIKKYWDSVYKYVLLLVPGLCMCAGLYWTVCKGLGLYPHLQWIQIIVFDCSQLVYLSVGLYFIFHNRKDSSYIPEHLLYVKGFIVFSLFVQYNFILYLFPSYYVWECTFLFFACIVFLFDSKLMLINVVLYLLALLIAHLLRPDEFLPLERANINEIIFYRCMIFVLTAMSIVIIVYFAEHFLIQARESDEDNMELMEKQLKYYKDMELLDKELRRFRHDIKNHFICLETLFNTGKTEELQEYFRDLQQAFSFQNKIYVSGNDIIDAILHYDLPNDCREEVRVSVYGSLPQIETVSAMDLCTLFSNLLSNAITSANQCADSGESQLTIHFSGGDRFFCIEISNTIQKQNGIKVAKKDRNHGHGIRKMKKVLDKYDGRYELKIEGKIMMINVYLPI